MTNGLVNARSSCYWSIHYDHEKLYSFQCLLLCAALSLRYHPTCSFEYICHREPYPLRILRQWWSRFQRESLLCGTTPWSNALRHSQLSRLEVQRGYAGLCGGLIALFLFGTQGARKFYRLCGINLLEAKNQDARLGTTIVSGRRNMERKPCASL